MGGGKNHHKNKKSGNNKPKPKTSKDNTQKPVSIEDISTEFQTIILDFLRDIDCSFPEYRETLSRYLGYSHEMKPMPDELYIELYTHCKGVYPVKFFDILYKTETLFASGSQSGFASGTPSGFASGTQSGFASGTPSAGEAASTRSSREGLRQSESKDGSSTVSNVSRASGATSATNNASGADKEHASGESGTSSAGGTNDTRHFLPGVDFREIWNTEDITENTKDIIWKYLQLILFSIVNNLSDMGSFGDTAKLFEAIDDNELKTKLEEVIGEMGSMFGASGGADDAGAGGAVGGAEGLDETFKKATEFMNDAFTGAGGAAGGGGGGGGGAGAGTTPPIPDAGSIHEHLSSILNGKIGKLAKEIAEETAADLNLNMENETSMKGVFQQLLKNPTKLSGIIKSVGSKLDSKLKSGELKESEIMQEASELMSKMKNMPGMNNLASMLSKMGMNMPGGMGGMGGGGGGGGGGKVNFGAMQSQLNKNLKQAQMRERLQKKVQERQQAQQQQAPSVPASGANTAVFSSGDKPTKTPRTATPATNVVSASASAPATPAPVTPAPVVEKQKSD